jgi:hypothetical protein
MMNRMKSTTHGMSVPTTTAMMRMKTTSTAIELMRVVLH